MVLDQMLLEEADRMDRARDCSGKLMEVALVWQESCYFDFCPDRHSVVHPQLVKCSVEDH